MKILFLILPLFIIVSCASGPSPETLAKRAKLEQIKKQNAELFVEMFMAEIWNQKIAKFSTKKISSTEKITPFSKELKRIKDTPLRKFSNKCNNNITTPKLAMVSRSSNWSNSWKKYKRLKDYAGHQWHTLMMSLDFKSVATYGSNKGKCVSPKAGPNEQIEPIIANYPFAHPKKVVQMLKQKGMPLSFCYEPWNARGNYKDYDHIVCTFEAGPSTYATANFSLSIKRGRLLRFQMGNLITKHNELNKTFAELYLKRWENPEYLKKVRRNHQSKFRAWKGDNSRKLAENARLDAIMEAEQNARDRAYANIIGSSITRGAQRLTNSKIGLADPRIQAAGKTTYVKPQAKIVPAGQPTPFQLKQNHAIWCVKGGGKYNSSNGRCSYRKTTPANNDVYAKDRANCLKQGRKWMGDRCNSKINQIDFHGRACSDPTGKTCKTGETVRYDSKTGQYINKGAINAKGSGKPNSGAKKALAYCFRLNGAKKYTCDGPVKITTLSVESANMDQTRKNVGCPNYNKLKSWEHTDANGIYYGALYTCTNDLKSGQRDIRGKYGISNQF